MIFRKEAGAILAKAEQERAEAAERDRRAALFPDLVHALDMMVQAFGNHQITPVIWAKSMLVRCRKPQP